jgi:ATP-dependent RNA circularization protein (DNA/RNA ligase family)
MAKLTTFKEAAELHESDPSNKGIAELLLDAAQLANEQSELEYRALKLGDAIVELVEQMNKVAAAEAAQQLTEIRTTKRKAGQ